MIAEEENNELKKHLGPLFRSFEPEPPPGAWEVIRNRIQAKSRTVPQDFSRTFTVDWSHPGFRLYPVLTILALIVVFAFLWLSLRPSYHITGSARVGEEQLCRGTAYLFRVHDLHKPWDSVRCLQQQEVDSTGRFAFTKVPAGNYLVRVQVHPASPSYPAYRFGYHDNQLDWNKATVISTKHLEKEYTVQVPRLIR